MRTAFICVACSVAILIVLIGIYVVEDKKDKRIFLSGFRSYLDRACVSLSSYIAKVGGFFGNRFVRLLLHYGLHSILRRLLSFLQKMEKNVEELARHNRKAARALTKRTTRNHLDEIADHKQEVALTPQQKKKLLSHD